MSAFKISAVDEERWNVFTYVVFVALIAGYGWLIDSMFGTWTWAAGLLSLGAGAASEVRGRASSGVAIFMWLAFLVPLMMTLLPALATLLGLSKLVNGTKKNKSTSW